MPGAETDVVTGISESGTLNGGMLSAIGDMAGSISPDEALYIGAVAGSISADEVLYSECDGSG
jgi:hypothetical protein